MKLYNYFHRNIETFTPIHSDFVGMYLCGPTVYSDPHLGHARSAVCFDVLYRYLQYKGYAVRYVRNVTDVGHLEDEEREQGEDKIEKMARIMKMEPMQVAHTYTLRYRQAMDKLNVLSPSIEPLATGHILEQQIYVSKLLEKGYAYEIDGNVYFDVEKFISLHKVYGTLSGKQVEDLLAGQRELKNQAHKRSGLDFALWKTVSENQSMHWISDWSTRGVPGWHTECCAMSEKYLGLPFDIHGGGLDLQFPHHEAEIAQAYALHGKVLANYWLYNNMITIDHKKMSKSAGNFISMDMFFEGSHEKLSHAYRPELIRFFLLRAHYRSIVDVSDEALRGVLKGLAKLERSVIHARSILFHHSIDLRQPYEIVGNHAHDIQQALQSCMDDDLDTPGVIAELFKHREQMLDISSYTNSTKDISFAYVYCKFYMDILGLGVSHSGDNKERTLGRLVDKLLELRTEARAIKNFEMSDKLRDSLLEINIEIKDSPDGSSTWTYKEK